MSNKPGVQNWQERVLFSELNLDSIFYPHLKPFWFELKEAITVEKIPLIELLTGKLT